MLGVQRLMLVILATWSITGLGAEIQVDTTTDEFDQSCSDGDCSLRDAIHVAAAGDTVLVPSGTYVLIDTSSEFGAIEINKDLTIRGSGAEATIIDADNNHEIFIVGYFASEFIEVNIGQLSMRNGLTDLENSGGAVFQSGSSRLTLHDCRIYDSVANVDGGAVALEFGAEAVIERCAIHDNEAKQTGGGGISVRRADLSLIDSVVFLNSSTTNFPARTTEGLGGGLLIKANLANDIANVLIKNSTIAYNDGSGDQGYGGIQVNGSVGDISIKISNSIVASNFGSGCGESYCNCSESLTSLGHNLEGNLSQTASGDSCGFDQASDLVNVDPKLEYNQNATSIGLKADSPAVDAGSTSVDASDEAACTAIDQLGRYIDIGGRCDMGATERNSVINDHATLQFDSNGGTAISAITDYVGQSVTPPDAPTRTGYSFNGWSPAIPQTVPDTNSTHTAQWTINQYTLTFDSAGGSAVTDITQDYGSAITPPDAPTRTGYSFNGWSPSIPETMPAGNLSVTATWVEKPTDDEVFSDRFQNDGS